MVNQIIPGLVSLEGVMAVRIPSPWLSVFLMAVRIPFAGLKENGFPPDRIEFLVKEMDAYWAQNGGWPER